MLFTNKSPLKTYYYYAPLHRKLPAINCLFINKSILLTPDSHLERTFPLKYKQMMLFSIQLCKRNTSLFIDNLPLLTSDLYLQVIRDIFRPLYFKSWSLTIRNWDGEKLYPPKANALSKVWKLGGLS